MIRGMMLFGVLLAGSAYATEPPGETAVVAAGEVAPFSGLLADRERAEWYLEVIDERDDLRFRYSGSVAELAQTKATLAAVEEAALASRTYSDRELRKATAGTIILAIAVGIAFGGGVAVGVQNGK